MDSDGRQRVTLARRSLDELERVAPQVPVYLWTATPQGLIDAQSSQFLRYLGCRKEDLENGGWVRFVHPDDLDRILDTWRASVATASAFTCEYRVRHHTGEYRWFLVDAQAVLDDSGNVDSWIGTAVERHAERIAELELERTSALLRTASRLGRVGAWSLDLRSGELSWSDEVRALHEVDADFVPAVETAIDFYLPDDRPVIETAVQRCIERAEPYDVELRIVTARGSVRWCRTLGEPEIDEAGEVVRLSGAFQDVTDAKLARMALLASEERFRTLSKATSDVVVDADVDRGVEWYSDGLADLLAPGGAGEFGTPGGPRRPGEPGPSSPDASDAFRPFGALRPWIHPDDAERVEHEISEVLRTCAEEWEIPLRLVRPDGEVVHLEVAGTSVCAGDGRVQRLVASLVDVTAARELERRLAHSQHLEALGQLTGGIAHDFNNLLAVVIGGADLLADAVEAGSPDAAVLDRVRAAAQRGADLTSRLLAFARQQPLDPEPVDVAAHLEAVASLVRGVIGEHVELSIDLGAEMLPPALVDPGQLENALVNLCVNARDAMPEGGALTLRARPATLDEPPGRPAVAIEVVDSGSGMSPEVLEQALEPFFTTKEPGRGTGLGLSMVYGFVEQSSGSMTLESEPGAGTTVRLLLPVPLRAAPASSAAPTAADPSSWSSTSSPSSPSGAAPTETGEPMTILVVEDDPLVRSLAVTQLTTLGHRVLEAVDGPSALEVLRRPPDEAPIELLFTDVVMPGGLDGRQLAQEAVTLRPDVSVLFTTGYVGDTATAPLVDGRPMDILPKPYRLVDLRARLIEIRGRRDRRDGPPLVSG